MEDVFQLQETAFIGMKVKEFSDGFYFHCGKKDTTSIENERGGKKGLSGVRKTGNRCCRKPSG